MNRKKIEGFLQLELPRFKRSEKVILGVVSVVLIIAAYNTFYLAPRIKKRDLEELLKNRANTIGHVHDAKYFKGSKGNSKSLEVNYWYYVSGKKYHGVKDIPCIKYKRETAIFENKDFPLIYSKLNPQNHLLIIGYREHLNYGFQFPDSLRPISQQYFNCLESGYW